MVTVEILLLITKVSKDHIAFVIGAAEATARLLTYPVNHVPYSTVWLEVII